MSAGESARAKALSLRTEAERLRCEADRWETGAQGEERVGAVLDAASRDTTRVLHDRLLKPGDSNANLDHLVVSSAGVHLIDSKNWIGQINVHNDSLWQHWTTADGRQTACKNEELYKVRGMAAEVQKIIGRAVTPVLCLASDGADKFADDGVVRGVHVIPVHRLLGWLEAQPSAMPAESVATLAVQMSVTFPPATGDALRLEAPTAAPLPASPARRKRARRSPRATSIAKVALCVAVMAGLLAFGSQVANGIAHLVTAISTKAAGAAERPTTTSSPTRALTARQVQALDDWRIRAQLYRDNAKPSVLAFVPDSSLGSYGDECRTQAARLAAFRHGLLHAPDKQLATAARQYDAAVHRYLDACRNDRPVLLHHAEGAMAVAANDVNLRYDRLLGRDPASYATPRVL